MYYETTGEFSENAVVFLHGWGGSVDSFGSVIRLLPESRFFVNLDFSGFGKSAEPERPYCVDDYVNEVKNLLDLISVKKVTFVCHSFGGRVAIKFINRFPDFVEKVVFVDSAGIRPPKTLWQRFSILRYKIKKKLVKCGICSTRVLEKYGSEDYKCLSLVMKATFVRVVNEDLSELLTNIQVPTLIVWGEKDKDTPVWMAHRFHKAIKGSRLIVYKDSGHFSYLDNLDDFVYSLYNFLTK